MDHHRPTADRLGPQVRYPGGPARRPDHGFDRQRVERYDRCPRRLGSSFHLHLRGHPTPNGSGRQRHRLCDHRRHLHGIGKRPALCRPQRPARGRRRGRTDRQPASPWDRRLLLPNTRGRSASCRARPSSPASLTPPVPHSPLLSPSNWADRPSPAPFAWPHEGVLPAGRVAAHGAAGPTPTAPDPPDRDGPRAGAPTWSAGAACRRGPHSSTK